ncbi:MAG: hypothetical protein IPM50_00105 [Acidobacteriota bacterium]|nr:MAG: hypothetical protein IPM50_00105 [Acidobacteriota bacterium]
MEILNSGSFIPLDNKEKMEQLAFTATTLATEVSRSDGFQSGGQANHQLGLELWSGAEYVCRAHEEATIKNLFLSKFLQSLREIEKQNGGQPRPLQAEVVNPATPRPSDPVQPIPDPSHAVRTDPVPVPVQPVQPQPAPVYQPQDPARDEYLGIVSPDEQGESNKPSYADECAPGYDPEIEALVEKFDNESSEPDADISNEPVSDAADAIEQSVSTDLVETEVISESESESGSPDVVVQSASTETRETEVAPNQNETTVVESIDSIVIPEKEPYNFDGCTVTSVVQLLPESDGVRKCVVSVRTHDFTPRVTIVDVEIADALSQISATLGLAFEQYRNELPARAAEKVKKEKPAKKQSKSPAKAGKAASTAPLKPDAQTTSSTNTTVTDQNLQGGLFTA